MKTHVLLGACGLALACTATAGAADDAALIKSAESAAPAALSSKAAIYAMDDKGQMRTLREGTNGWWCMPDSPATPGPDPMCGDANAMEWAMAWIGKKDRRPRARSASCTCWRAAPTPATPTPMPHAPAEGNNWIKTGPHVMVVNAMDMHGGLPESPSPDTASPM